MIKHILAGSLLMISLGLGGLPASAQQPAPSSAPAAQQSVSEADLQKFVKAAKKLEVVSQERNKMISQIFEGAQKADVLSLERFKEIHMSKQNPEVKLSKAMTQDEQQKYDRTLAQLLKVQQATRQKMNDAVSSEIEVPKFFAILETIQQTPALQKRVDQMLQAK